MKIFRKQIKILIVLLMPSYILANSLTDSINLKLPHIESAQISAVVINGETKQIVYSKNTNIPHLIASNVKLFTTLFALKQLHPDFTWQTGLYITGIINNHTLNGNVYIKGGGDPTLTSGDLYVMLAKLKQIGINKIDGNIILDSSIFNSSVTYSMLTNNNYDPDKVIPSGLMFNHEYQIFNLTAHDKNITIDSDIPGYTIKNMLKVDTSNDTCSDLFHKISVKISENSPLIILNGNIPIACKNKSFILHLFSNCIYNELIVRDILNNLGFKYSGNVKSGVTPPQARLIIKHFSPRLDQVLIIMNKYSDNLYAETLLLTTGAYNTNNQDTFKDGKNLYLNFLYKNNLIDSSTYIENGAGLSRHETFSVNQIAHLLNIANDSNFQAIFEATLPIPGEDGTLKNIFSQFTNTLHLKTGSLNDTRAYSGYFYAKDGTKYIISVVANDINDNDPEESATFNSWLVKLLNQINNLN